MGLSKSCPNLAIYGDTGEIPLSLKSYRLALNFWHRITSLKDTSLAKIALLENIELRTNWIITIAKLTNTLKLSDKIGNHNKFKGANKRALEEAFRKWWKKSLDDPNLSRLQFYKKIKSEHRPEKYLDIHEFELRKHISKLRCSDHVLEIEKGRHKKGEAYKEAKDRKCIFCKNGDVEDEEHFVFKCDTYTELRRKYRIDNINETSSLFTEQCLNDLGNYLKEAFELRKERTKTLNDFVGVGVGVNAVVG